MTSMKTPPIKQRLDQWLWHARFFKTRTLATTLCKTRKIRIDGRVVSKAAATICPDQVLTFPKEGEIRVVKVLGLGNRRGPASEAATLYEDLTPPQNRLKKRAGQRVAQRKAGTGRPTKKDRRALVRLKSGK